jgi:predicted nucleotidyltransferase
MWVFGSFARGAPTVGDVDLLIKVDEVRDEQQFFSDTFWGRKRPFADHVRALGAGGASFMSVHPYPVHVGPNGPSEPASLRRRQALKEAGLPPRGFARVEEPRLLHEVTEEPLRGPFVFLWARGDELQWTLERLHAIPEDPFAERHERTTTVPLIDDLTERLGLLTAFRLAAQIRQGNVLCRALVLQPRETPRIAARSLQLRYQGSGARSARALAAAAALARLESEGTDLRTVRLNDGAVTAQVRDPQVDIGFVVFDVFRAVGGSLPTGRRHWHVWASGVKGPWLALEVLSLDHEAVLALDMRLTGIDRTREERAAEILAVLGLTASE